MGRRKKGGGNGPNKDAWLNTYADMITLILVFFVLLFSMSTIDAAKYELLVEMFNPSAVQDPTGSATDITADATNPDQEVADLEELYQYLTQYVESRGLQDQVQVSQGDNVVGIQFMSSMFFNPDSAVLTAQGRQLMVDIGTAIRDVQDRIKAIRVDGHTAVADSPISDRDLSTDRANTVLKFLEAGYVSDPSKLLAVGYGQYHPIASNDTEEGRAQNRRVEIIISQDQDLIQDFQTIANSSSSDATTVTTQEGQ
ncbi:MAG: flagellar motor protein MotB [Eubacteriaceae bacterium]|jgi:chemotaxis protein MotB|nr:chemotaxis protein MotB [Eubacteriaceae bacterium]